MGGLKSSASFSRAAGRRVNSQELRSLSNYRMWVSRLVFGLKNSRERESEGQLHLAESI